MEEEEETTTFHNVSFLGKIPVENPKDETRIKDLIGDLNSKIDGEAEVSLSFPRSSTGDIVQRNNEEGGRVSRFPIHLIIYFAVGRKENSEGNCFAFTHASSERTFECRVYRCPEHNVACKMIRLFVHASEKRNIAPTKPTPSYSEELFEFNVNLEIQESCESTNANVNGYKVVPRQKGLLKLRSNVVKKVVITVKQIPENRVHFRIERCFGMLVSPGRNVRHEDMQLLEKVGMTMSDDGAAVITGIWDPKESAFALLNQETTEDVYMTVAADLVILQIAEPIRFIFETRAIIFPQTERYWYYSLRSSHRLYSVILRRRPPKENSHADVAVFDLVDIKFSKESEVQLPSSSLTIQLANSMASLVRYQGATNSVDEPSSPVGDIESDGDDEPLLSGFGEVSKDFTNSEIDTWSTILKDWTSIKPPPKQLEMMVKKGIPEALRGEVWQRLTRASEIQDEIVEKYKILITKESPDNKVIMRDIHRTFPAHDFFKKEGGVGQEALYRISKAYSVYDSEVGYCQGQSFLIAALLLQMPEEQAFGVLIQIMQELGLRDIFKENFEELQLRLYQLDKLIEAMMPDLFEHFAKVGLESHMYASQWFLTLFTAKFPLFLVFRVIDVFLYFGFDSIFQVALGILKVSKKDMLSLDFEGLMKYFRVNIPKRYRSEDHARYLLNVAVKIKLKKLNKYTSEWKAKKEAERAREDPVVRYERENKRLLSDNLMLDTENDNLARELVNSKVFMRKQIDTLEDTKDELEKEVSFLKKNLSEVCEEKKRLEGETDNLKFLLKRELEKLENELAKRDSVIEEYRTVCSQLNEKLLKVTSGDSSDSLTENPIVKASQSNDDESILEKRVRELELELAQTKLALVETECKNQDLTHQYNATLQDLNSNVKSGTWLSKTFTTIKETAARNASSSSATGPPSNIKKSNSYDTMN